MLTKQQHVLQSQKYDIPIWGTDRFTTNYWRATNSPIVNETGDVACIVHVTLDITSAVEAAQKERFAFELAEARRKATEEIQERLRLAVDSAQLGTWHVDVQTRAFTTSARFKELYGYNPEEELTFDDAIACIKEEYRDNVLQGMEAAITENKPYDLEYPVIGRQDSTPRWIRATGKRYDGQDGRTANLSGTIMDITEKNYKICAKMIFSPLPVMNLKPHLQH